MKSTDELKEQIRGDAERGVDFGCSCYYCGATPIGLVERGDCIPILYGNERGGPFYCYRCGEGGFYNLVDHIEDPTKQKECREAFRMSRGE